MTGRRLNTFLVVWYLIFFVTAVVIEPTFYFLCGAPQQSGETMINIQITDEWNIELCDEQRWEGNPIVAVWKMYSEWDPLFQQVPRFLMLMCSVEVFLFGPLYLITALCLINFAENKPDTPWIDSFDAFCFVFSGAVTYSTIIYFGFELLFHFDESTNMKMVILVNCPWTVIPLLLIWQRIELGNVRRRKSGKWE
eukprot:TRINITY_DN12219_c0_g1_i1.p1 TRINITY_DN12219_c0_g1~~TRINITY_DN12219_c0_g1_i1.p1  ORF type:complete len:215 (-),score=59.67 TRINITY_DN12219_c0_g1_i1:245-829(-)